MTLEDAFIAAYLVGVRRLQHRRPACHGGADHGHRERPPHARARARTRRGQQDGGPIEIDHRDPEQGRERSSRRTTTATSARCRWTNIGKAVNGADCRSPTRRRRKRPASTRRKPYSFEPFTPTLPSPLGAFHSFRAAQTGVTGLCLAGQPRCLPAAWAKRRISSPRSSAGSIDGVDHELGGEVQDVDVARRTRSRSSSVRRGALAVVVDRLQLVVVDGVDRRLRPHHGDRGARQRDAAVGLERGPGHRVEPGAVGLAHDHRDLRHGRLADRADHLGAVADDALALDLGADHEAGHVGEEQQRHVEGVARPDEARGLVGGVGEQHAALVLGLVGHDPDRAGRPGARSRRPAPWPSAAGSPAASPRRRPRRSAA